MKRATYSRQLRKQDSQRHPSPAPVTGSSSLLASLSSRVKHVPGAVPPGSANEAIIQAMRTTGGEPVFVAGPGCSATALWAAEQGSSVGVWVDSIAESSALRATFSAARLPAPSISSAPDFADVVGASHTHALVHLPRGVETQKELLHVAGAVARPGGRIVFVGAVNEGIKGAVDAAQRLFGQAGVVVRKGGYHAAMAQCPSEGLAMPRVIPQTAEVRIDDQVATLIWYPGVFAAGRVDAGAAALIQAMDVHSGEHALDLGCGLGVVGLAALRRGAIVEFTDVSSRAVASTRATLTANGYPQAPVHFSNLAESLQNGTFDVVLANPPFHRGHGVDFEVAQSFVQAASRLLRAGGKLYLVANAFLRYEAWLEHAFRQVTVGFDNDRYKVWTCVR